MKKLILLIITLATFSNLSYASFPVTENLEIRDAFKAALEFNKKESKKKSKK